jgi:hypothetical protein
MPDSVSRAPLWNAEFKSVLPSDTTKAVFTEVLVFTLPSLIDSPLVSVGKFIRNPSQNNLTYVSMDNWNPMPSLGNFNFAYSTGSTSYTAAAGGFPLGDLNWFPARKADWITAGKPTTFVPRTETEIPNRFSLGQNYPNPFNPTTTIEFSLAKSSYVTLKVFDMLGREVANLVDGNLNSGIVHQVQFNAAKLSSGIYYYRLEAGSFSHVKKLVLMK